jgi:hypothetical protein
MLRATTGFHPDQARRTVHEMLQERSTLDLLADNLPGLRLAPGQLVG